MIRAAFVVLSLVLLTAPAAAQENGYKNTYVVKKGDTLGGIAKRHKTSVGTLKRWNRMRSNRIRRGQKLVVYTLTPPRPRRIIKHRIKRGDTLSRIAKRYGVTVNSIKRVNRMRRRARIIAGKTLKIEVIGPEKPAIAVGKPQHGTLKEGERLGEGPGWHLKKPTRVWGTNETVTHLMTCIPRVKDKFRKGTGDIVIGDISKKGGGFLAPHKSHQNGLDVDIGYYLNGKKHSELVFKNADPKNIDARRTWHLLQCFLDTRDVEYIFVDYSLQKSLFNQARRSGMKKRQLKEVFQYPRSRGIHKGIIRHQQSHKNHFHIRFKQHGNGKGTSDEDARAPSGAGGGRS